MAKIVYKVNAKSGLNIRAGSGTNFKILGAMSKGIQATSDEQSNGWAHLTWNGITGWACMDYLTEVSRIDDSPPPIGTTSPTLTGEIDQTGGMSEVDYGILTDGTADSTSVKLFDRYLKTLGCPPQFNKWVDLQYFDKLGSGVGRRISETFFVNPAILSLCPGEVNYLPGFSSTQQDQFFNALKASVDGAGGIENTGGKLSGKLYEFKSAYTSYINRVNVLCRALAVYLGIGDTLMPGSSMSLKNFDYGYWTTPEGAKGAKASIFGETAKALSTIVTDNSYIHFFVNHQGTSVSESIDTSITASDLENTFNSSNIHSLSRNLEFLFGGTISNSAFETDVDTMIKTAGTNSDFIKQFGRLAKNYLSGGRLIFPQMIDSVGYSKALNATLKFISPYGDKLSIFLKCYVPILHLLALTLPKQMSDNMYGYPYLVRAYQQGWCNFDLAVITNLRLTKGGSDLTAWTIDGLPTEVEASFDITPLYTNLMSSDATQPFMFLQNTSLAEYLATMAGVDLKANNLWAKIDMAKMALTGKVTDLPTNLGRSIIDTKLVNGLQKFFHITN